jgi:hypothetical protein
MRMDRERHLGAPPDPADLRRLGKNFPGARGVTMGGYGSGRSGGRPTVESALRLDIDAIRRWDVIRPGAHLVGEMTFDFYDDKLRINFESCAEDPRESWLRLQYAINDYWTGELYQIDDKIYLAHSRPTFGGLRWWFVCPCLKRRVRKLYLPLGGRHFWSRVAYRLAYASQRETLSAAICGYMD